MSLTVPLFSSGLVPRFNPPFLCPFGASFTIPHVQQKYLAYYPGSYFIGFAPRLKLCEHGSWNAVSVDITYLEEEDGV